jgi:hypothetical protein
MPFPACRGVGIVPRICSGQASPVRLYNRPFGPAMAGRRKGATPPATFHSPRADPLVVIDENVGCDVQGIVQGQSPLYHIPLSCH